MLCECGCGKETKIARQTRTGRGWIKGQPLRFIAHHQMHGLKRWENDSGYILLYMPEHPSSTKGGCIREHVFICEKVLGKYLPIKAQVHHFNEIKSDNRNENLVICEDAFYHQLLHKRTVAIRETGNPNSRKCKICHEWMLAENPECRVRSLKNGTEIFSHVSCERESSLEYYYRKIKKSVVNG